MAAEFEANESGVMDSVTSGLLTGGAIGLVVGSARAFLGSYLPSVGTTASTAKSVLQKGTIPQHPIAQVISVTGLFASVGVIYCGTRAILHEQRGTDDMLNKAIAGCAAGSAAGIRNGNIHTGCGACVTFALANMFLHKVDGKLGAFVDVATPRRKELYEEIKR